MSSVLVYSALRGLAVSRRNSIATHIVHIYFLPFFSQPLLGSFRLYGLSILGALTYICIVSFFVEFNNDSGFLGKWIDIRSHLILNFLISYALLKKCKL